LLDTAGPLTDEDIAQLNALRACRGPKTLQQWSTCEHLDIYQSDMIALPKIMPKLARLTSLYFYHCSDLVTLHLSSLPALTSIIISGCDSLTSVSQLRNVSRLAFLEIDGCKGLTNIMPELSDMPTLTSLTLRWCRAVSTVTVSQLSNLPNLRDLDLSQCSKLESLPELIDLPALTSLTVKKCPITSVPGLVKLLALTSLTLSDCALDRRSVSDIKNLPELTSLAIGRCCKLTGVSGLRNLPKLTSLYLEDCVELKTVHSPLRR
jgi:Leucine-rich repeat (LRR) protein